MTNSPLWFVLGVIGQRVFGVRFIVQWLYSKYKKQSIIPVSFGYLSLVMSILFLTMECIFDITATIQHKVCHEKPCFIKSIGSAAMPFPTPVS